MRQLFSRVVSKNANWHERAGRTSARTHQRPISACWTALFPGIAVITFANRSGLIRAVESYSGDAKPGSEASECARRGLARCPPRGNSRGSCAGIGNDAKAHRRRLMTAVPGGSSAACTRGAATLLVFVNPRAAPILSSGVDRLAFHFRALPSPSQEKSQNLQDAPGRTSMPHCQICRKRGAAHRYPGQSPASTSQLRRQRRRRDGARRVTPRQAPESGVQESRARCPIAIRRRYGRPWDRIARFSPRARQTKRPGAPRGRIPWLSAGLGQILSP